MAGIAGAEAKSSHLEKQVEGIEITLDMARVFKLSKPSSSAALSQKKKKKKATPLKLHQIALPAGDQVFIYLRRR